MDLYNGVCVCLNIWPVLLVMLSSTEMAIVVFIGSVPEMCLHVAGT